MVKVQSKHKRHEAIKIVLLFFPSLNQIIKPVMAHKVSCSIRKTFALNTTSKTNPHLFLLLAK